MRSHLAHAVQLEIRHAHPSDQPAQDAWKARPVPGDRVIEEKATGQHGEDRKRGQNRCVRSRGSPHPTEMGQPRGALERRGQYCAEEDQGGHTRASGGVLH